MMKEQILDILKKADKALTYEEIDNNVGSTTKEQTKEVIDALNELEEEYLIYRSKKDKFLLLENSHLKKGFLSVNKKGYGFVLLPDEEDLYIDADDMNGAIHNDLVLAEITTRKGVVKREGRILKILKRDFGSLVGEYYISDNVGCIKLDDRKVRINIKIPKENSMSAMDGHKVQVKIVKELGNNNYEGEVIKILGHKNDPGVDILSIVYKYNINDTFSDAVMTEVDTITDTVSEDEIKRRTDLRNEEIFTIDGDDAKDLDDAVSLKKLDNGNYLLGVHIADVSYYVKENNEIDKEAYDRGTSVYLVDRVIPMLPHKLSNGICSLNGGVDRLTVSCDIEIDNNGNFIKYNVYESVINSKKRMTYKKANKIIEENITPEGYEPFVNTLKEMKILADILRKNKEKRGYIDFDTDEAKVIVDETGKPTDIKLRERGSAEKVIEDFMIAANEAVASYIFFMELPFVYRIHEYPKEEKITNFIKFVSFLGYKLKPVPKDIHPKYIQSVLEELKGKKEYKILSSLLLRCMQKAVYLPQNLGHYGLASKCYTHFTSPIRRYPDTTVHRLLRTYIFNNNTANETRNYWEQKLVFLTEHSSQKERDSIECEREVDDMKMAEYMESHIGEEYQGMISSVMPFGFFVELNNLVEGLVHINDLDDYYIYSEETQSLIGERNKKIYRIGDELKVKVKSASKEAHTIDFEVVKLIQK
jgi:ribonuclease R